MDHEVIIMNTADRILFDRCCAKLRLIDREIAAIGHVEVQTYKHEPNILYEVHESHQDAAITHIYDAILQADEFARRIQDKCLRLELMEDVMLRRNILLDVLHGEAAR